jgi:citrate lyase beta subunit
VALYEHAMADLAMAAHTAHLPWLLARSHHRPDTAVLPTRAHEYGAAGVMVHEESAARGMNSLFTPDPTEVAVARATLLEWERVRGHEGWVGVVAGEVVEAATYDRLVDRRTVRRARTLLALVDAIAAREAAR